MVMEKLYDSSSFREGRGQGQLVETVGFYLNQK